MGVGRVPHLLSETDDRYRCNRYWCGVELELHPSEYFRRNWKVGLIRDPYGVQNRDAVGVDNMMWATDYPHPDSTWPNSQKVLDTHFQDVDRDEARRMICENAARIYRL